MAISVNIVLAYIILMLRPQLCLSRISLSLTIYCLSSPSLVNFPIKLLHNDKYLMNSGVYLMMHELNFYEPNVT